MEPGPPSSPGRIAARLTAPVDIAALVYFRLLFGSLMVWEVLRYFTKGWISRYYIEPEVFFTYYGFSWVRPWPGGWMYVHFAVLGLLAACIALGAFYRLGATLFFLGFTYVFLLDQSNYLNHFYLISLISFLMIFVPAHRAVSVDAGRRPALRRGTVPAWTLYLLRFQVAIPYLYGGIAKLTPDWLAGEPIRGWMRPRFDLPPLGPVPPAFDGLVYLLSYGGLLFDLLVVPALLWRRTRVAAFGFALIFNVANSILFRIGVFPWFMIAATALFFEPDWPRRALRRLAVTVPEPASGHPGRLTRPGFVLVGLFLAFQVLFPLRHLLYPDNVHWTEEGHRFAWHMMLRHKTARVRFEVRDPASGESWEVDPADRLSPRQRNKMTSRPDMILQFAHFLAREQLERGRSRVTVHARATASLNSRGPQRFIDPEVDLAGQPRTLGHWSWIEPLADRPTLDLDELLAAER